MRNVADIKFEGLETAMQVARRSYSHYSEGARQWPTGL